MTHIDRAAPALTGQSYSVLRHGGASPARALAELALPAGRAAELEAMFRVRRPGKGSDAMRPRFARHAQHVAAVLAAGGYPAMSR